MPEIRHLAERAAKLVQIHTNVYGGLYANPSFLGLEGDDAAAALAVLSLWLFATLVPFTDFVATRSAKVSASLGGTPLSPQEIQAYQDALGLTSVYHKLGYRAYRAPS